MTAPATTRPAPWAERLGRCCAGRFGGSWPHDPPPAWAGRGACDHCGTVGDLLPLVFIQPPGPWPKIPRCRPT